MIEQNILNKIKENNLSLETCFLLNCKYKKVIPDYNFSSLTYLILKKKGWLTAENILTEEGIKVCQELFSDKDETLLKDFDIFWETCPADDAWGGYYPTRRIKNGKARARISYLAVRKEYSAEDILKALENHITMIKNSSIGQNNMRYLQNPATWLSNRTFESFLEDKLKKKESIYTEYGKEVN